MSTQIEEFVRRITIACALVGDIESDIMAEIKNPEDGTWEGLCAIHNALAGVQEANKSLTRALRSIKMGV